MGSAETDGLGLERIREFLELVQGGTLAHVAEPPERSPPAVAGLIPRGPKQLRETLKQ